MAGPVFTGAPSARPSLSSQSGNWPVDSVGQLLVGELIVVAHLPLQPGEFCLQRGGQASWPGSPYRLWSSYGSLSKSNSSHWSFFQK